MSGKLHVFEQQGVERSARTHGIAQFLGCDALPFTGNLDVGGMRRLITAKHDGNPAHSFAADQADFYARLVGLDSDDRGNTGLREIHSFDPSIWSL